MLTLTVTGAWGVGGGGGMGTQPMASGRSEGRPVEQDRPSRTRDSGDLGRKHKDSLVKGLGLASEPGEPTEPPHSESLG